MSDRITAPWEEHEVAALNGFQRSGVMHPFTCGGDHELHQTLIAERDGWHCPDEDCGYRQDWAWAFMAEPTTPSRLAASLPPLLAGAGAMHTELKRVRQHLRETEDQLAESRRQLTAALLRIQALQVHEAIQRIPAQPPDADGGLCEPILYAKPVRDVPTGGVL